MNDSMPGYGVFVWNGDGCDPSELAIPAFHAEKLARESADQGNEQGNRWGAGILGERDQELVCFHPIQAIPEDGEDFPLVRCLLWPSGIRLLGRRSLLGQKVLVRLAAAGDAGPWDVHVRILWNYPVAEGLVENGGMLLAARDAAAHR